MYELETQDNFTAITPFSDSELPSELTKSSNFSGDLAAAILTDTITSNSGDISDEILLDNSSITRINEISAEDSQDNNKDLVTGEAINQNVRENSQVNSQPTLDYATLLGGTSFEQGNGIAIDNQGNIYLTGNTNSSDFPVTPNAVQNTFGGGDNFGSDAFVAKISSEGNLLYSTYIGGSGDDFGTDIAVDNLGNIYVTGNTTSANFPTINALQNNYNGGQFAGDAFVTKISADGSTILYSTYLGGQDDDESNAIAVDDNGNVYVAGSTGGNSPFPLQPIPGVGDFPTTPNARQNRLASEFNRDIFVTKISPNGSNLVYSTLLGGNDFDVPRDMALDSSGNVYLTGDTRSPDFPVVNATQGNLGGDRDVFIAQLNSDGSDLIYSSFYGAGDGDTGEGIALDNAGNIYVSGSSGTRIIGGDVAVPPEGDFPTFNALQSSFGGGGSDGIIMKINSDRSLGYATYLGGENGEFATKIAVDAAGSAYVTGNTSSGIFPPLLQGGDNPFGELGFPDDAFVTKISTNGGLEYSISLGGSSSEQGNDIVVESGGRAYVIGSTNSSDFPAVNPVNNSGLEGNAFLAVISRNATPGGGVFEGFTESVYLAENPEVAEAINNGLLSSGFEHWLRFGYSEGRSPQIVFDEDFYLATYPGVADAVANEVFVNGLEHYVFFGEDEGREAVA